jgi:mannose-1-phosphate guanylyltransferase
MSSCLIQTNREVSSLAGTAPVSTPFEKSRHLWAVLLAGGDGTRLQSLTRKIAGDSRPKQFCRLVDGTSLLEQTRARVEPLVHADRQLFVVTRAHETYYRQDLGNTDISRIIVQPSNRGTGVAIALAIVHILQRDPDALVAFFPCDHYYSNDHAFASGIRSAASLAEEFRVSIVLLGAEASYPEVEYGWIEPGPAISHASPGEAFQVNRFWEKPSFTLAEALLRRGCFWNTFVTIGRASAFLDLMCSRVPPTVLTDSNLEAAYELLPPMDFSRDVLTPEASRLLVVPDRASGWFDLGSPARLLDALARSGIRPTWLRELERLSLNSMVDSSTCLVPKGTDSDKTSDPGILANKELRA